MKKTKVMASFLASASLAGALLGGPSVLAADASGESDAKVQFKAGTVLTPPTEPGTKPGTGGDTSFKLIYVPTEFDFGSQEVGGTATIAQLFDIDPGSGSVPGANPATKKAAVGDLRGTKAGWTLTAKLSAALRDDSVNRELTGATINLGSTSLNSIDPEGWGTTPVGSNPEAPAVYQSVEIGLTEVNIMHAEDGKGQGYWQSVFTDIQLEVPANVYNAAQADDEYTGIVVWTLHDAPQ